MATAKVDIKGDPKDFLAALEKSKKKIKDVRGEAGKMMAAGKGGSNKAVAMAAAGGAAIGSVIIENMMKAIGRIAKSSNYLSGWQAAFGGIDSALATSKDLADLDDRAKAFDMQSARLLAAERAADLAGGLGSEQLYKTLSIISDGMAELSTATGDTDFGLALEKLGLTFEQLQGGDALDNMEEIFKAMKGISGLERLKLLEQLGFSAKTRGAANAIIGQVDDLTPNMERVYQAFGGKNAMQNKLEAGMGAEDQQDTENLRNLVNKVDLLTTNLAPIVKAVETENARLRAEERGAYEMAPKIEQKINEIAGGLDKAIEYAGNLASEVGKVNVIASKINGIFSFAKK